MNIPGVLLLILANGKRSLYFNFVQGVIWVANITYPILSCILTVGFLLKLVINRETIKEMGLSERQK